MSLILGIALGVPKPFQGMPGSCLAAVWFRHQDKEHLHKMRCLFLSQLSLTTASGATSRYPWKCELQYEPAGLTIWRSQSQNQHWIQGLHRNTRTSPSTAGHHVQVVNFCLMSHLKDSGTEEQLASARSPALWKCWRKWLLLRQSQANNLAPNRNITPADSELFSIWMCKFAVTGGMFQWLSIENQLLLTHRWKFLSEMPKTGAPCWGTELWIGF